MDPERDNEAESINHETPEATPKKVDRNPVRSWLFRAAFLTTLGIGALSGGMKEARAAGPSIPPAAAKAAKNPVRVFPMDGQDPKEAAVPAFSRTSGLTEAQVRALFDFEIVETKPSGLVILRAVPKKLKGAPETSGNGPDLEKAKKFAKKTQTNPLRVFPVGNQSPIDAAIDMFMRKAGLTGMTKGQVKALFKFTTDKKPSGLIFVRVTEGAKPGLPKLAPPPKKPNIKKAKKIAKETQKNPLRVFPIGNQSPIDAAVDVFMRKAGLTGMTKDQVKSLFWFTTDKKPSGLIFVRVTEGAKPGLPKLVPPPKKPKPDKKKSEREKRIERALTIAFYYQTFEASVRTKSKALKKFRQAMKKQKREYEIISVKRKKKKWVITYSKRQKMPTLPGLSKTDVPQAELSKKIPHGIEDQVRYLVKRHLKSFKKCHESELKRDNELNIGKIKVSLLINTRGKVVRVKCTKNNESLLNERLVNCIKKTVKKWQFPRQREELEAHFPLLLVSR